MWDLTLMTIFINHPLYVGFSSSQYGAGVLQLERYETSEHDDPPHDSDIVVSNNDERMLILFTRLVVTPRVIALHLILET